MLSPTSLCLRNYTDRFLAGVLLRRRSTLTLLESRCSSYLRINMMKCRNRICNQRNSMIQHQQQHQQQHQHQTLLLFSTSPATATITFPQYSCPSVIITQPSHAITTAAASTAAAAAAAAIPSSVAATHTATVTTAIVNNKNNINHDKIHMSDLRALFIASSIPMIGFGFMDQFVLIQAGGYIDATFGISFGLATLSAAAAGQVVSDVSGVVFGGALERFLTTNTSWLRTPNITQIQRQLPICRNVAMLGAIVGVIIGCAIGATSLLFVDLEARNRMERAQRLREIVQDMISTDIAQHSTTSEMTSQESTSDQVFSCDSCTVYVVSTRDLTLPTDHNSNLWKVNLKDISSSMNNASMNNHQANLNKNYDDIVDEEIQSVQRCIASRSIVVSDDRRIMYAPLLKRGSNHPNTTKNDVMAVVAFRYGMMDMNDPSSNSNNNNNNNDDDDDNNNTIGCYSDEDILTARVMARHIAIFMDR